MKPTSEIKTLWKKHRGPNLTDTSHRLHCFEAGFRAGRAAGIESAAAACESLHHPFCTDVYAPYGRCSPDCMGDDYADAVWALVEEKKP